MDWATIQSASIALGSLGIAGGYLFSQFRSGSGKAASELITILQKKDEEQKGIIADYQSKFEEINKQLGILQGQLIEKDKKIDEYMAIFQGKNPESTQYMDDMRKFTVGVADYMKGTVVVLNEVKDFMQQLNQESHLHTQQNAESVNLGQQIKDKVGA